ncbi:MAG: hypothetical protein WBD00_07490 [Candidatus Omnitrophota bacterium]
MMKIVHVIIIFCMTLAMISPVSAQVPGNTSSYTTMAGDVDWTKDVDKKLDTTIKVLEVIKEELEDYKKSEEKAAKVKTPDEDAEANWAAKTVAAVRRMLRAWRKVKEVTAPEDDAKTPGTSDEDDAQMTRDISNKLDQTIKAMTAIKTELDKMEEEMDQEKN